MALADAPLDAQYAHRHLGPISARDEQNGWLVLYLVWALTAGERPIWYFAEDPGAASWLSPPDAPAEWIPWLSLVAGARPTEQMTEAQKRAELAHPVAHRFGAPGNILAAVLPFLTEPRRAVGRRRTDPATPGDRPGDYTLVIHSDDVPDDATQDALEAAARAAAWAGLRLHFVYETGRTWADLMDETTTWADAAATYPTWQDAVDGP